jgi:hypothetical protein
MPEKRQDNDDWNWHAQKPKQDAATHVSLHFQCSCSSLLSYNSAPQCASQIIARNEQPERNSVALTQRRAA